MTDTTIPAMPTNSEQVRATLVETLELDLVGPWAGHELAEEQLYGWERPSNWYLTGFLIPSGTPAEEACDPDSDDEFGDVEKVGSTEDTTEDTKAAKKSFYPSSMGLSFLVDAQAKGLTVRVQWGDYRKETLPATEEREKEFSIWQRVPREELLALDLGQCGEHPRPHDVPNSKGLQVVVVARTVETATLGGAIPEGTQSVSVFLVNNRNHLEGNREESYAFQPVLLVACELPFVPRPDLRGLSADEWDDRVSDLHYADAPEYATGHGISADWAMVDGRCFEVRTQWLPKAQVERTVTEDGDLELCMDTLGALGDGAAAREILMPLVENYRGWVDGQRAGIAELEGKRRDTAEQLLNLAGLAVDRIEGGILALERDAQALEAFKIANRAVSAALKKRLSLKAPKWRAFQLAFVLLNLAGMADPSDDNRETVDLLFFPTGGGKTEAYLGLAAFAMVLRRLQNPGDRGQGVSVMMRYTLRLLTLDQLSRAAGLVCALELERQATPGLLGDFPFEIGLWVGKAATPNQMGRIGDKRQDTARLKTTRYKNDPKRYPSPIPLEECPWCGEKFTPESFSLLPNADNPTELRIVCSSIECEFCGDNPLPILAVDDVIYRRRPAFLIATVDKFATLPWVGASGELLGRSAQGNADSLPPDLIIQDELHLISGPLGTMAGLYETAIEALCLREEGGKVIRPKIVASTATVRRAQEQIQALFGRMQTRIFPPPGPNRHDSFLARTKPAEESPARLYLGVGAQGRNPKMILKRTWTALMAAAQKCYMDAGKGEYEPGNPADPYMTVLGYFNSLRELGGSRRILEEEVQNTLKEYGGRRRRVGEQRHLFQNRRFWKEVVELTSRVSTDKVAEAKQRLGTGFESMDQRVDSAIATNMISVGLDIQRLGLMVVMGQPKTHSEYIQATSRVGRDHNRPGLVVTLLNVHKPRDRSHYERFLQYHETFYRMVEVSSVTPFSSRALDRGLAGALVSLARHKDSRLTPAVGVQAMGELKPQLAASIQEIFAERVRAQGIDNQDEENECLSSVRHRLAGLLDSWTRVVDDYREIGEATLYQRHEPHEKRANCSLLREMLETKDMNEHQKQFRVNRSLRDVEPVVKVYLQDLGNANTGEGQ